MQMLHCARAARSLAASSSGQSRPSPMATPVSSLGVRAAQLGRQCREPVSCGITRLSSRARHGDEASRISGRTQRRGGRSRRGPLQTAAGYKTFEAKRSLTMTAPPENPQFTMQSYLQDTSSIVQMSFPDSKRRSQVAPDKWRVQLLPIQFMWTVIRVSCTVRAWGDGQQAFIAGRELWIDGMPPELGRADSVRLAVDGQLSVKPRSDRKMALNGIVKLAISADIPDLLLMSPGLEPVVTGILDGIIGRLQESISKGIIADYDQWQRRRAREAAAAPVVGTGG